MVPFYYFPDTKASYLPLIGKIARKKNAGMQVIFLSVH